MTKLIAILMVVGVWSECGGDSPTEQEELEQIDEDIYREGSCGESCEWAKTFGDGYGMSVQKTVDGGFIVTGRIGDGFLLLKTDGQGNEQWRKTFGVGLGTSVPQTVDGGFVVTGRIGGWRDGKVLLLKTTEVGYTEYLEDE